MVDPHRARPSVYLIRGFDYRLVRNAQTKPDRPAGWWRAGEAASALRLGHVALRRWAANVASARARFVVPAVTPRPYVLMFCDAGCMRPWRTWSQ